MIKNYSSKNLGGFYPILGMILLVFLFSLWFLDLTLIFFGNLKVKTFLIILYIFKLLISKKRKSNLKFLNCFSTMAYFKSYTLIVEEEISREKVIICGHPHGLLCLGTIMMQLTEIFESLNLNVCICHVLFYFPISGLIANLLGLKGVNKSQFNHLMKSKKNILFMPGGYECAIATKYDADRVYIKNRLGFVKYALQNGYRLYPMYTFNESKTYFSFDYPVIFQKIFEKLRLASRFFFGNYFILPIKNSELKTVIGSPILLPQINNPTLDEVKMYHAEYVKKLNLLYDKYNDKKELSKLEIL